MNKITIISIFTASIALIVLADRLLGVYLYPGYTSMVRCIVPVFFWCLYTLPVLIVRNSVDSGAVARYLMFFKGAKMLGTLVAMFVLAFIFRDCAMGIILNFFVYYMLLLLPESILLARLRK